MDAATGRRTVMRLWTILILGAIVLSLALPSSADARLRFGRGAVLGAVVGLSVGAMFGGLRHSSRHHRRSATRPSVGRRSAGVARIERDSSVSAPRPAASAPPERTAAIFWPDAAADLVEYLFFPKGNDRFWAHGYDAVVDAAFAASDADDQRGPRGRPAANQVSDAASPAKAPLSSADLCSSTSADADANALIERIEQAIAPSGSQRNVLEQLRAALAQAIERIKATCPIALPTTLTERLNAIQDRIWAMHDALLTIRLPLENFYNSLTDEQRRRLRPDEPDSREIGANVASERAQMCAEPAGNADSTMRAIERAARPTEQQRRGLEALRLRSAAMAQLIASSCPTHPLPGHMGRFAAVTDRLDVMLFAVMSMSPVLQDFYESLNEQQKVPSAQ
jgi:LTXXQ motif family protein